MGRILTIGVNTFREAIRNKILYSLLFFAVLVIVGSLAFRALSVHGEVRLTTDLGLAGINSGITVTHPNPFAQIKDSVVKTFRTLWALINPRSDINASHLSGPIAIIDNFIAVSRAGLPLALWFTYRDDPEAVEFLDCAIETIDAVLALAARYAEAARRMDCAEHAAILEHVPANRPRTFHEALQSLRLMHAVVWLSRHYHVGLGRFDQYMWPYLKATWISID